jgi:hypothetical protein
MVTDANIDFTFALLHIKGVMPEGRINMFA